MSFANRKAPLGAYEKSNIKKNLETSHTPQTEVPSVCVLSKAKNGIYADVVPLGGRGAATPRSSLFAVRRKA